MTWFQLMIDSDAVEVVPKHKKKVKKDFSIKKEMTKALFQEMLDVLFFFLGIFTYFYFFSLAWLYFGKSWDEHKLLAFFVNALSEPYLGAVAMYTILKEYRKKSGRLEHLHKGEFFVACWAVFLVLALLFTIFSDQYVIGLPLKIIMTNSVTVVLIYVGSIVHKP
ncbi:MAG: hypothetical protein HZC14_01250 [Candidatus Niyogibacteria bacterium]|nr:hypothetical protein [Candidatus Niyogibacteria bacterium]